MAEESRRRLARIADLAGVSLRCATPPRRIPRRRTAAAPALQVARPQDLVLLQHRRSVEEYFWDHPPRSTKEAAKVIFVQTGVRAATQVPSSRPTSGLRHRKVAAIPVPPKKTVEEHAQEQSPLPRRGAGAVPGRGPR